MGNGRVRVGSDRRQKAGKDEADRAHRERANGEPDDAPVHRETSFVQKILNY
jgi:hypothetical protein